jgi:hypothetical protein
MTNQVHPLANHTGQIHNVLGFCIMASTAAILFGVLSGMTPITNRFMIGPEVLPWGAFAWPIASLIYKYQIYIAYHRPDTRTHYWLDLLGSLAVFVVLAGAAASWFPVASNVMERFNMPLTPLNVNTVLVVSAFLWFALPDVFYYQFHQAEVGIEGIRTESAPAAPAYSNSVDLIINEHSIERMGEVIGQVIAEKLKKA